MRKPILLLSIILFVSNCFTQTPEPKHTIRHIVLWTLNESIPEASKKDIIKNTCDDFYQLKDKVQGVIYMNAIYEGKLPSSNCDFMFELVFESEEALKNFSKNPAHQKNAKALKPYIKSRTCLDVLY